MGMTRAKRYANHKGGRKYGEDGKVKEKVDFEGRKEKEEASNIFREVWNRAREHEGYKRRKQDFLKEQRGWDKANKLEETPHASKTERVEDQSQPRNGVKMVPRLVLYTPPMCVRGSFHFIGLD